MSQHVYMTQMSLGSDFVDVEVILGWDQVDENYFLFVQPPDDDLDQDIDAHDQCYYSSLRAGHRNKPLEYYILQLDRLDIKIPAGLKEKLAASEGLDDTGIHGYPDPLIEETTRP